MQILQKKHEFWLVFATTEKKQDCKSLLNRAGSVIWLVKQSRLVTILVLYHKITDNITKNQ